MTAGPEQPPLKRRVEIEWFHGMLALLLGVQAIVTAPYALMAILSGLGGIVGMGLLGIASVVALIVSALALLGRVKEPKPAAVFLLVAGGFLFAWGFFVSFLASCGSIVNCGSGPYAYGVLINVVLLAALDLASAIVLWKVPPRVTAVPPDTEKLKPPPS